MPGKAGEVLVALRQEGVAAFARFIRAVGESRGFTRKDLLPDQAIVNQVETKLEHALRRRRFGDDRFSPAQGFNFEFLVRH